MSEGFIVQSGTIEGDLDCPPVTSAKHLRVHFNLRTTPSSQFGAVSDEPFLTEVVAYGPLAADLLTKIGEGDRVLVQGRMRAKHGTVAIYATLVAVDVRSLPSGRVERDLTSFELAVAR